MWLLESETLEPVVEVSLEWVEEHIEDIINGALLELGLILELHQSLHQNNDSG